MYIPRYRRIIDDMLHNRQEMMISQKSESRRRRSFPRRRTWHMVWGRYSQYTGGRTRVYDML